MALNTFKCNRPMPLHFKGLNHYYDVMIISCTTWRRAVDGRTSPAIVIARKSPNHARFVAAENCHVSAFTHQPAMTRLLHLRTSQRCQHQHHNYSHQAARRSRRTTYVLLRFHLFRPPDIVFTHVSSSFFLLSFFLSSFFSPPNLRGH